MTSIAEFRNKINILQGRKSQVADDLAQLRVKNKHQIRQLLHIEKAKEIVREVGMQTQKQLEFHISDITSMALEAIFSDAYKLEIDFVQRRNKTECDIFFSRNDARINPVDASGGGAVDVAAFALRIASWSMKTPRTQNTIILDEPMRFLSQDKQEQASLMIKELSKKLDLQFIIVTHEQSLSIYADKVFNVKKKGKYSKVN